MVSIDIPSHVRLIALGLILRRRHELDLHRLHLFRSMERLAIDVQLEPFFAVMADEKHAEFALDALSHLLFFRQDGVLDAFHVLPPAKESAEILNRSEERR